MSIATRQVGALAAAGMMAATAGLSGCSQQTETLTVFAAASLEPSFTKLGEQYKAETGNEVNFSFGGSADLLSQLKNGAPADVLATADEATMKKATEDSSGALVKSSSIFAKNEITIATADGNPKHISDLASLNQPDLRVVTCAAQVPCGRATKKITDDAGVALKPVSEENSVTDVLGKLTSGQADAALVYRTDVKRASKPVAEVEIPTAAQFANSYPIARTAGTKNDEAAQKFIEYVLSDSGRKVLDEAGFDRP